VERLLIFIKHRLVILWRIIEWGNGIVFSIIFRSEILRVLQDEIESTLWPPYSYRTLTSSDSEALYGLINSQESDDLKYFKPHGFDTASVNKQFENPAMILLGVFNEEKLIGYFFLRFFVNRKCFVGRLIDKDYRGKGIGDIMNKIMYETAWRMSFRCLSTISKNNKAVVHAHEKNPHISILKELSNDYLLVEFINT